jgi:hypothetical protein
VPQNAVKTRIIARNFFIFVKIVNNLQRYEEILRGARDFLFL